MNLPASANPSNPTVVGSTCHVPVWSDSGPFVNDTNGNPTPAPNTLLWTNSLVFDDNEAHQAPMSCTCCRISVDTSCAEDIPLATAPKSFRYIDGTSINGTSASIELVQGVALSTGDTIELRNNTWCGYAGNANDTYTIRSSPAQMLVSPDSFTLRWTISTLPADGCYRLCYFHSNLTTPQWSYVGDVVVNAAPAVSMAYALNAQDVLLVGNDVTINFNGVTLLSAFDDAAELRTSGACGSGSPTVTTEQPSLYGKLDVAAGVTWCTPALARRYTTVRPIQLIQPRYSDCPIANRVYLDKLHWSLTLPAAGTYTVCYRTNTTWNTLAGSLVVPAQNDARTALTALYTSTTGAGWTFTENWLDAGKSVCLWYGVRCNAANEVTGVFLSGNNLVGPLPLAFFRAIYFNTITELKLDMNGLTGSIPPEIGLFRKLQHFDIGFNANLTGSVPVSLLSCSLFTFYCSNTGLTGNVPHSLTLMTRQWYNMTTLAAQPAPFDAPFCPVHDLICSDIGSTDSGVSQCGNTGITEAECLVQGCCYNIQAPLTFGGTSCFTKKPRQAAAYPTCLLNKCAKL